MWGDGGQAFTLGFRAGQTSREELSSPLPLSKGPMAGALGDTWKRRAEGHRIQHSVIQSWVNPIFVQPHAFSCAPSSDMLFFFNIFIGE